MKFRKDHLLLRAHLISLIILFILSLAFYIWQRLVYVFVAAILFAVFAFIEPIRLNEFVVINQTGIYCYKKGEQQWGYKWEEIAELCRFSPYNQPAMTIILYPSEREPGQPQYTGQYFQLCRTAKEALNKYYRT